MTRCAERGQSCHFTKPSADVSAGYFAGGLPGAVAGWLAMITPALLIIPLVHFVGRKMEHPRVKSILQTIVIASAGLLLAAAIPLGRDGLTGPITWVIAVVCFVLLFTTKLDTLWMILGAALVSLTARQLAWWRTCRKLVATLARWAGANPVGAMFAEAPTAARERCCRSIPTGSGCQQFRPCPLCPESGRIGGPR